MAVAGLLALLLLPALAANKAGNQNAGCLSNLRRMQVAWEMYRTENNDVLMPNAPLGTAGGWCGNSAEGWGSQLANTSTVFCATSIVGQYLNGNISALRCPADQVPSANGNRLRSYAMNSQMGALYDAAVTASYNPGWLTYTKGSDLVCPTPASAFVFLDENPETIDDGYFQMAFTTTPAAATFVELPAAYMEGAGGFSFADGHGEIHRWVTSTVLTSIIQGFSYSGSGMVFTSPYNTDWSWLTQHATCQ